MFTCKMDGRGGKPAKNGSGSCWSDWRFWTTNGGSRGRLGFAGFPRCPLPSCIAGDSGCGGGARCRREKPGAWQE